MFLSTLPGYAPNGKSATAAILSLDQLEQRFRRWLVTDYLNRHHSEINMTPKERWESFPFIPRLPDSLDQLNVLLLTVAKTRRVQRDGIKFSGFRYFDVALSGFVGEDVVIRYDPRDLSSILVYSDDSLICKASSFELSGKSVSLKEVKQARSMESKLQRAQLKRLLSTAEKHASHADFGQEAIKSPINESGASLAPEYPKFKIKRFACDDD